MYVPPRAARERRRGNMVAELLPRLDPTRREDRLITEMIEKAEEVNADAIGMSGLLVKSTLIMQENLVELNERGIATKTGNHFRTRSGLLMRIPMMNTTKSPSICAQTRSGLTPAMGSPSIRLQA